MSGGGSSRTAQTSELPQEVRPLMAESSSRMRNLQEAAPLEPFLQANPMRTAGLSANEQIASGYTPSLFDYASQQGRVSDLERMGQGYVPGLFTMPTQVTGANIQSSPSYQAAQEAFRTAVQPGVENQSALAGLGRSTALTNATAAAKAQYMLPMIQNELALEGQNLDRANAQRLSAINAAMQTGAVDRQAAAQGQTATQAAIQQGLQTGGIERDVAQQPMTAEQQDYLRRQALSEQALMLPFGSLVPSSIGQQTKTTGSSGMFK